MTGAELKRIREAMGLSRYQMGRALGMHGQPNTIKSTILKMEGAKKGIPPAYGLLARFYDEAGGVPEWAWKQLGVNFEQRQGAA